mgnify:CR=1 FL=1|jgi:hypothetical protein
MKQTRFENVRDKLHEAYKALITASNIAEATLSEHDYNVYIGNDETRKVAEMGHPRCSCTTMHGDVSMSKYIATVITQNQIMGMCRDVLDQIINVRELIEYGINEGKYTDEKKTELISMAEKFRLLLPC